MRIETLTVNVTIERDSTEGERAFAHLFDKYSALRDEKLVKQRERSQKLENDRLLSPDGGRQG